MSGNVRISAAGGLATLLASLALMPAFREQSWFWPGALTIVFVTVIGASLRHLGTPRILVPIGQLAALGWAFMVLSGVDEVRWMVLPTAESVQDFLAELELGLSVVAKYAAPVPPSPQLTMTTALGVGLVAIAVDLVAATLRLVPWAGLPLLLLYSIPATTVEGGVSALAFVPAAVGYIVLLVSEGRDRVTRWGRVVGFSDRPSRTDEVSTSIFGQTGRRVGVAVVGLAVIVPWLLPTMPEGLIDRGSGGTGLSGATGQTVRVNNPMVDLRRDLRMPDNFVVMTYTTDAETSDYIRLVTLDEFDGQTWRPSRSVRPLPTDGQLPAPRGLDDSVPRETVTSRLEISEALQSDWLPLFYPPKRITAPGDWTYDPRSLDVLAGDSGTRTGGMEYTETSVVPQFDGKDLRDAPPAPGDVREQYTALPPELPERVLELAESVTKGADNNYDEAAALQEWFRTEFTYSLETVPGHGGSHLLEFIEDRRGYCEQFAATMAIMARSLNIPARVAVGYQSGTPKGNAYEIRVQDAHAWPELYFSGYGWVRFEPTPVQQTGSPPSWTSIVESSDPDVPTTEPTTPTSEPAPEQTDQSPMPEEPESDQTAPLGGDGDGITFDPLPLLLAVGALIVLLLPGAARLAVRRHRLTRPAPDLAESCWVELADTVRDLGYGWDESATPRTIGEQLSGRLPETARDALWALVHAVEQSRYAPTPNVDIDLRAASHAVISGLSAGATRPHRLLAKTFPATLWRWLGVVPRLVIWPLERIERIGTRIAHRLRLRRTG